MTPTKDDVKARVHEWWAKIQKVGFWWLIVFMIGATIGFRAAGMLYSSKFDDAIKLGGVIHRTLVYDIRLRP